MNSGLSQQLGSVQKAVSTSAGLVEQLSQEEAKAAKNLNSGLSSLDSARIIGEDYVNEEGKKAQQAIQRTAGNDLQGLEGVMGSADSAQEKAKAEQDAISRGLRASWAPRTVR